MNIYKETGEMLKSMYYMYSIEGRIQIVLDRGEGHAIACYDADTSEGQNGAPMQIVEELGRSFVNLETIGVHIGYDMEQHLNVGTLITKRVLENFIIPTLEKYHLQYGTTTVELPVVKQEVI